MPSRVLETVLTGRNLLSPVLTGAARDVETFDGKVTAANARAGESASTSAARQEAATAKITAANAKAAESASTSSAKTVAANTRSSESARAFADVSESSAARAGLAWTSLATKALPIAAAAAIVVTGKMAGDYQQLVTKLVTTAGAGVDQAHALGQGMLDMAGKVGISADELAKGMYTVESSLPAAETGAKRTADALLILKASAEGAKQENADLGKVTDAVSTILHDYHEPASDAAKVTSQLITAVSHGKTTFDELTGSLHSVTPLAAKLHLTLADVTGTLSAMTASGESADQATQNMADTLRHLANPTSTMIAELSQLGISTNDLQKSLDSRGLAGTLQMVEEAIVQHLDPATQRVLLPALNKSKSAVQDLHIMMGQMPPDLAKLSQGLVNGSVSIKDYQKSAKDLGGQQGAMALQFLSLLKNSQGFNNVLKAGGPAAQVFTAAMAKSIGTTAGLNVMLQTTGENAAATNAAIKDIGGATAQADGNIKGWAEVQNNLNQKLAEAGAEAKTLAIEAGQHLLPVLTGIVGWVGSTGLPGIAHLGSGIGTLVHDFMQLPGPVKDAAYALAALKLAETTGLLGKLGNGTVYARVLFSEFGDSVRGSMGKVSGAFREAKASSAFIQTLDGGTANRFTGTLRGIGAAAGEAAKGGLSVMKSAGSGLVNLLGGPWMVGIAAATFGVSTFMNAINKHNESVKADTEQITNWYKAMASGGKPALTAANDLKNKQNELAAAQAKLNDLENLSTNSMQSRSRAGATLNGALRAQKDKVAELSGELSKGEKKWNDYWKSLSPQEQIAQTVAGDEANLALAIQQHGAASRETAAASETYNADLEKQKQLSVTLTTAEQTQIDKLNALATAQLGSVSSTLAADQAQSQLADSIAQYAADAKDGQHSSKSLADESRSLAQQAIDTARAVAKGKVDQMAANGVTDDGTVANATMLASLKEAAKHITGPGHDALMTAINDLGKTAVAHGNVQDAVSKMGLNVQKVWDKNTVILGAATDQQIQDLKALGYTVKTLPNGKVVVTSNTKPAVDEINKMLAYYRHQALTLQATLPSNGAIVGAGPARKGFASGGLFRGAGTGTSDSNLVAVSDHEFIVNAAATQANLGLLHAINSGAVKGFAAGGLVGGNTMQVGTVTPTVHMDTSGVGTQLAAWLASEKAALTPSVGPVGSGVERWRATVDAVLRALGQSLSLDNGILSLISHESGGNPNAINLTDSNARAGHPSQGPMQTIPSTFYAYAGPYAGRGITDGFANIYAGTAYALARYGAGMLLQGGNHVGGKYVGYKTGTDYVPADGPAYLHKGEAVIPADRNPFGTGPAAAMPGYGNTPAPQVTVQVLIDGQEFRGMATTIVNGRLQDLHRKKSTR